MSVHLGFFKRVFGHLSKKKKTLDIDALYLKISGIDVRPSWVFFISRTRLKNLKSIKSIINHSIDIYLVMESKLSKYSKSKINSDRIQSIKILFKIL